VAEADAADAALAAVIPPPPVAVVPPGPADPAKGTAEVPPAARPAPSRPPGADAAGDAVTPVAVVAPLFAVAAPADAAGLLEPWVDVPEDPPVPVVVGDPDAVEPVPAALERDVPLWPVVVWTTVADVYPGPCGFEPLDPP
jgi:hypothetical protein